ncbi:VOC family protein [Hymenobacter guriensis]|uniref:VOC family protein n=1 Tax=Hymenobacter guriensis TaxID=2793065 RepID=A0ABS0L4P2_9BACT|nr:VOC family protein [Hymenobacter guriensis]MBG8554369.1 VOC family protein [Hymenobacter guriensis]
MQFISVRLITADLPRLVSFYEQVTGLRATHYTPDFAELLTPAATLALQSTRAFPQLGEEPVVLPGQNRSAILEFRVSEVDADYHRLAEVLSAAVVQPPTTMPWGNRSLLFRDPDGNLVNFFTPVTPEARRKFGL